MIMAVTIGFVLNCNSLFIKPICEDLGWSRQSYGIVSKVQMFFGMISALFAGKVYSRFQTVSLWRFCTVLYALSYSAFSIAAELWQFCICSIIVGVTGTFCTVIPISRVINNWFIQRNGFAFGVSCLGSGIGGMLFSLLTGQWIEGFGWRTTYKIHGVIVLSVMLFSLLLIIRDTPADKGMAPLGTQANTTENVSKVGLTLREQ